MIDGQQRLTTLTILCAVLRDLTSNAALRADIHKFIEEPEVVWDDKSRSSSTADYASGTRRSSRSTSKYDGSDATLLGVCRTGRSDNDSQKAIRDNAAALHQELASGARTSAPSSSRCSVVAPTSLW